MTWRYNEDTKTLTKDEANLVFVNQVGDTMTGDLDMNSKILKNAVLQNCVIHTTPRLDNHPITKNYLDQRLRKLDTIYVNEAGDTMEGPLRMTSNKITGLPDPVDNSDATNKNYVDTCIDTRIDTHRSHFTYGTDSLDLVKNINMNNKSITGLADPIDNTDAVNMNHLNECLPIYMPFNITKTINKTSGTFLIKDISLARAVNNLNQIVVLTQPNNYIKSISREVKNYRSLTIDISVGSGGVINIGSITIVGVVVILPSNYTPINWTEAATKSDADEEEEHM